MQCGTNIPIDADSPRLNFLGAAGFRQIDADIKCVGVLIEQRSVDSFICGFRLAWEMANELNHFETNRHPSPEEEAEMDV